MLYSIDFKKKRMREKVRRKVRIAKNGAYAFG
jgi:hypothetical protein